jgi:hypothetical protein
MAWSPALPRATHAPRRSSALALAPASVSRLRTCQRSLTNLRFPGARFPLPGSRLAIPTGSASLEQGTDIARAWERVVAAGDRHRAGRGSRRGSRGTDIVRAGDRVVAGGDRHRGRRGQASCGLGTGIVRAGERVVRAGDRYRASRGARRGSANTRGVSTRSRRRSRGRHRPSTKSCRRSRGMHGPSATVRGRSRGGMSGHVLDMSGAGVRVGAHAPGVRDIRWMRGCAGRLRGCRGMGPALAVAANHSLRKSDFF